jgi:hypothetical protein
VSVLEYLFFSLRILTWIVIDSADSRRVAEEEAVVLAAVVVAAAEAEVLSEFEMISGANGIHLRLLLHR